MRSMEKGDDGMMNVWEDASGCDQDQRDVKITSSGAGVIETRGVRVREESPLLYGLSYPRRAKRVRVYVSCWGEVEWKSVEKD